MIAHITGEFHPHYEGILIMAVILVAWAAQVAVRRRRISSERRAALREYIDIIRRSRW